jgi:hypothetical protein
VEEEALSLLSLLAERVRDVTEQVRTLEGAVLGGAPGAGVTLPPKAEQVYDPTGEKDELLKQISVQVQRRLQELWGI